MIGIMPFLISNLNPDLQTEISLAVQPLRVENSDLRRYVALELPFSSSTLLVFQLLIVYNYSCESC